MKKLKNIDKMGKSSSKIRFKIKQEINDLRKNTKNLNREVSIEKKIP